MRRSMLQTVWCGGGCPLRRTIVCTWAEFWGPRGAGLQSGQENRNLQKAVCPRTAVFTRVEHFLGRMRNDLQQK